ncbi:MAG TPA: TIGR01777 family oxidoreductase [Ktedonobacterales bacterium]|jgi:hypothetical protein
MRIVVAGGSGFIGRYLSLALVADGHTVTALTRATPVERTAPGGLLRSMHWNPRQPDDALVDVLTGTDAVVNLAGANIGSRRWTTRRQADLVSSRLCATETLVQAIERVAPSLRPRTLVNASGIDVYGHRGEEALTEGSSPGDTFLGRLCQHWERAAAAAEALGVRVVVMRTAVVLSPDALTLHLLAAPFRLFVGGPLGDGKQWFTWVHLDDVVGLYQWVLETEAISGPVNVVAPDVRPQEQVAHALGRVLRRPSALRTPAAILRLALGEQADLLLHGRRAVPAVATAQGYTFRAPELEAALRRCLTHGHNERTTLLPMRAASPFFPVLGAAADALPEVLREQYLLRPADDERVVLEGSMDRIWHQPFWLWPFFRLLAVFDILFPEQGSNIQAAMIIEGLPNEYACGAQTWRRTFRFRTPRRFDATMVFDPRLARVVERVRPGGVLEVVWNVTFDPPATIRIITEGMRLGVGRFRITLPRWAAVEVQVSETALAAQSQRIAVDLVVRHPWLGAIFGYTGRFQVRKEPKEGRQA